MNHLFGLMLNTLNLIQVADENDMVELQSFDTVNGGETQARGCGIICFARLNAVYLLADLFYILLILIKFPVSARHDANGPGFYTCIEEAFDVCRTFERSGRFT